MRANSHLHKYSSSHTQRLESTCECWSAFIPFLSCFCCSFCPSQNLCSQLKLSSGNSISRLMLSHKHTHTHIKKRGRGTWVTHLTHALTCPLSVSLSHKQREVMRKTGAKSKLTEGTMWTAHGLLVFGVESAEKRVEKESSSCVCQSEVRLRATTELSLLHSASLSFSRLSLSLTYTLFLSFSRSSWNHCVLWFTNPASVTWSNTSNIQHIFLPATECPKARKTGFRELRFQLAAHLPPNPILLFLCLTVTFYLHSIYRILSVNTL